MGNNAQSPIVLFGGGLIAFMFFISGPISGYFLGRIFLQARASATWPSVTGTLAKAQVGETAVRRYFADVRYSYRVDNKDLTGSKVRASDGEYKVRDGAVQAIRGLTAGQPVEVFYNPSNPRMAVLCPGAGFQEYALLFVPVMISGIGVGAFWFLLRMRRSGQQP